MKKINLKITGMHCASCASLIENSLNSIKGVEANVNYATESLKISGEFEKKKIESEVEKLGFKIFSEDEKKISEDLEKFYLKKFIFSLIFTLPVASTMFLNFENIFYGEELKFLFLIFATLNVFLIGFNFHKSFVQKFFKLQFNMDSLISIGTGVAIIYSIYGFFNGQFFGHFLEGASFIITFILLGKFLEAKTKKNAGNELKALFSLQEKFANKLNGEKIKIDELKIGDEILVKAGEKIPADGKIFDGNSEIDESMLSGESLPKSKKEGDEVFSGTININGVLKIRVSKENSETFLSKILEAVEDSQNSKAPIQKLADKISGYFVPVIIFISVLAYFYGIHILGSGTEKALLAAVSVLVVACPCALGLATPMALMVASGKGAKKGILIKKPESLEKSKKITAIAFDKTGTLTNGKPSLVDYKVFGEDKNYILNIVYSLAELSNHPFSKSISENLRNSKGAIYNVSDDINIDAINRISTLKIKNFGEILGKGVGGEFEGKKFFLGSKNLINEKIFSDEKKNFEEKIFQFTKKGETPICISIDGKFSGIFGLKDEIKNGSKDLIEKLNKKGIKSYLITGDNKNTAEMVGKELGIKNIFSEVLPKNKAEKIKEIQDSGEVVAFVGDGINDAVALSQSDLAIAMGDGSEVATESAEIVILNGNPLNVYEAIILSKKTYGIIKQNLFWAFAYNLITVPFAFLGLFQPMFASLAMSFSSVSVVLNSLRIR